MLQPESTLMLSGTVAVSLVRVAEVSAVEDGFDADSDAVKLEPVTRPVSA